MSINDIMQFLGTISPALFALFGVVATKFVDMRMDKTKSVSSEATDLRQEMREQIRQLRADMKELDDRLEEERNRNHELREKQLLLQEDVRNLQNNYESLESYADVLEASINEETEEIRNRIMLRVIIKRPYHRRKGTYNDSYRTKELPDARSASGDQQDVSSR